MMGPSLDQWLLEAKADPAAPECGMYLFHTGVVRSTPKAKVRQGADTGRTVRAVAFAYDEGKLAAALERAQKMPGIFHVRAWLNSGEVPVGGELMLVLVGGDIRPHVIDALQSLVGEIKTECVTERELYE
jgi:molybdopterin synthase catalytic subunit